MKHRVHLALGLLALLCGFAARATEGLAHIVEFEGEHRKVHLQFDVSDAERDRRRLLLPGSPAVRGLAKKLLMAHCSAGSYLVGHWRIEAGRLYLLELASCAKTYPIPLLYPGRVPPWFADWADAVIEVHDGPQLCHRWPVMEIHQTHIRIEIRAGMVVGITRRDMRNDPQVPPPSASDRWCLDAPEHRASPPA